VTYEAAGQWERSSKAFSNQIRQRAFARGDKWSLDEFVSIAGKKSGFVIVTTRGLRMAWQPRACQSLGREAAPLDQRGRASLFVNLAGHEMTLLVEMIVDLRVN
jgi:hypothetical protein